MLFILGLPPDSRCKFFNPDPPVKKKIRFSRTPVRQLGQVVADSMYYYLSE